jgi:hypothetical protein
MLEYRSNPWLERAGFDYLWKEKGTVENRSIENKIRSDERNKYISMVHHPSFTDKHVPKSEFILIDLSPLYISFFFDFSQK